MGVDTTASHLKTLSQRYGLLLFSLQAILGELPLILNDTMLQLSRDVKAHSAYILNI